eukprot:TRINITY_DN1486_c0_g1_i1.p1 TRINITY_DN1486_c0_g1~~TRINITY_DN1486_c0_g1_i1.p1  ORF type:complete len:232 (-),score=28.08 TRINITY_DN1486_c0_g1_i1:14-709(-)
MSTVGFGTIYPTSLYLHFIVFIQSFIALISDGVVVALIFSKASRPSRLRHTVRFSECAVVNNEEMVFHPSGNIEEMYGSYKPGPSLSFRIVNMRKRQICCTTVNLILMMKDVETNKYLLHELSYEINRQHNRTRDMSFSQLLLPLPWTVYHKFDENSPFYNLTEEDISQLDFELIVVFEGIDELTSNSFQSRWSYLHDEIKWDHKFRNMISRTKNGELDILFQNLSSTIAC